MNGAQAIIKCLEQEGVELVFGYPGVAICPFYDSILDSTIRPVLIRTEQNAAHAASGFARVTGKVGVCAVTSGPGATNLITGIATAFADSIPLVCITGQVSSELIGSDVFQEADITGAAESFVKYSYLVKKAEDIPEILKEAFYIANSGRKGPVLIDVPIDVQNAPVRRFQYPDGVTLRTYKPTVKGHAVQIRKVLSELAKAQRPVICAGGGILLGGAQGILREFAHKNSVPVVTTMMGIGAMQTADELYFGMVGNNGSSCANRIMNEADMIIMVGARVADRAVNQPEIITKNKVLVHIDIDPAEIGKNAGPTIPLVGDAAHIFADMLEQEIGCDHSRWLETIRAYRQPAAEKRSVPSSYVDPAGFVRCLSRQMEADGVYVADVGQNQIWSCRNCIIRDGMFLTSGGMGTMGYAIPAALGAKLGRPDRQVVAVCGDGSFQMSMMELASMRQHGVSAKIAVMSNHYLGMVREYQQNTYMGRYSAVELSGGPDLKKLSEAYGMDYIRLEDPAELEAAVGAFLRDESAVLLECVIDPMDTVK